jgi:hypothetical protein
LRKPKDIKIDFFSLLTNRLTGEDKPFLADKERST